MLEWSQIAVRGPQSEQFLQGQLSQDLTRLDPSGSWSLLLQPDSVVVTSCFVVREADGFTLTLARDLGESALSRLRRFHLRVDCTLTLTDVEGGPFETALEMISAGWPGSAEFAAGLTPQSFGASFVGKTVSFAKGCFTGQELVGRLDARGSSVPWRLVRAEGPSVARIDEVLHSKGPDGPQGVTTAASTGDAIAALGIAHRSLLDPAYLAAYPDVTIEAIP